MTGLTVRQVTNYLTPQSWNPKVRPAAEPVNPGVTARSQSD